MTVEGHQVTSAPRIGVVIPATNTVVEADFARLSPDLASWHYSRMPMGGGTTPTDEAFAALMESVRSSVDDAVKSVQECEPDHVLLGMSSPTFWGGLAASQKFETAVKAEAGIDSITTGALAVSSALDALDASTVAFLSPYQPIADTQVSSFLQDSGYEVAGHIGMRCPTALSIARVQERELVPLLTNLAKKKPDVIVQIGTNLSMVELADEAQRWLGIPVVAINAACAWYALRSLGVEQQFSGYGPLFREH